MCLLLHLVDSGEVQTIRKERASYRKQPIAQQASSETTIYSRKAEKGSRRQQLGTKRESRTGKDVKKRMSKSKRNKA
jgi:hypothetical protein